MRIILKSSSIYETEGVRLSPGANHIDLKKAKRFLENPLVKKDLESGRIVIEQAKRGRPARQKAGDDIVDG